MSYPSDSNPWFVRPQPNPEAETRLFLFPYAGGGPATFGKWPAEVPKNIETWIAHYPGRGSRQRDTAIKNILTLAQNISNNIHPLLDRPFVFLGHSLGALVAFESIRQLRQQDQPQPLIFFVSACSAPGNPGLHPPIHRLPNSELILALQNLNGLPAEIANLPELSELLLPILRTDFEAIETYHYTPDGFTPDCPLIAFGGLDDPRVSSAQLEDWAGYTTASFKVEYFSGDHFFINTYRGAVIASLTEHLYSSHAKF